METTSYHYCNPSCDPITEWCDRVYLETNHAGGNVDVKMEKSVPGTPPSSSDNKFYDWKMELQRGDGGWTTIGTRTGYVGPDDSSYRTFTNIGQYGTLRLVVTLYTYNGGSYVNTFDSPNWNG